MWKISTLNPKYEVNEQGEVRNCKTKKVLSGSLDKNGYRVFSMCDENGVRKDRKGHVLVATEFCSGRTDEKRYVNHKNFDKADNRACNLEWCTHQSNMEHWRQHQNFYTSLSYNPVKTARNEKIPVIQRSLTGEVIQIFDSYTQAERETGVSTGRISLCCRGKRHTAGGFVWQDYIAPEINDYPYGVSNEAQNSSNREDIV